MGKTVILSGVRTPFGKFGGALKPLTAAQLGGIAVKEALHRAGVSGEQVDQVILGTVLQGGQGQLPSRQAMRYAGIPWEVRTETINKVCASGMRSVTLGDQIIRLGDAEVVVAGGMESMSNAPYILPNARWGLRMGDSAVKDLMVYDGLTCSFRHPWRSNHSPRRCRSRRRGRNGIDEQCAIYFAKCALGVANGRFCRKRFNGI